MKKEIYMLIDYRDQFYSSMKFSMSGMNIEKIKKYLNENDYILNILTFKDVDFSINWEDKIIIYQSSEDKGLIYKSYIMDILMGLHRKGAILIPKLEHFYAHENKSFQAIVSQEIELKNLYVPRAKVYGTYFDILKDIDSVSFPLVIKSSDGCQSKGVYLAKNKKECLRYSKKLSSTFNIKDYVTFFARKLLKDGYVPQSLNLKKVIFQEFITNLAGDYKMLVYGNKVYVLNRKVRKNDFRASGSGLFSFTEDIPEELLDTAISLRKYFNCPYISLDLAFDNKTKTCYLIEYQFLMFGTYTLEKSPHHFEFMEGKWILKREKSDLEFELASALSEYIKAM